MIILKKEANKMYKFEDIRISLVWRTVCFKSEEEKELWEPKTSKFDNEVALQVVRDS